MPAGADAIDRKLADRALLAARGRRRRASTRWTGAISRSIAENYGGGPVGVETIAAALSEPRDAIEEIIEPFLIQQGFSSARRAAGCSPATRSAISASPSPRAIRRSSGCLRAATTE